MQLARRVSATWDSCDRECHAERNLSIQLLLLNYENTGIQTVEDVRETSSVSTDWHRCSLLLCNLKEVLSHIGKILTTCFLKINFNIIFQPTVLSCKWLLSVRFSNEIIACCSRRVVLFRCSEWIGQRVNETSLLLGDTRVVWPIAAHGLKSYGVAVENCRQSRSRSCTSAWSDT